MKFSAIAGQDKAKNVLRRMIVQRKMPDCLLLSGPSGVGTLPLAIAAAHGLVCNQPQDGEACGQCSPCGRSFHHLHPDVHFSFPTTGKDVLSDALLPTWREMLLRKPYLTRNDWVGEIASENQQANINKEECFSIRRKLQLTCAEASVKVMIIWLPEYLGKEGNRLLKILEDPPPSAHFILVSEQPDQMLPTILSRCQVIRVPPIPDEVLSETLSKQFPDASARERETAVMLAGGSLAEALHGMESQEDIHAGLLVEWMRRCYKGNGLEMSLWVDEVTQWSREKQKIFIKYSLQFFRSLLVLPHLGAEKSGFTVDLLPTAEKLRLVLSGEALETMSRKVEESATHLERNANPKIIFLTLSISFHQIMQRK